MQIAISLQRFSPKFSSSSSALGFKNFPMDQFGVRSPALRALARTPALPAVESRAADQKPAEATHPWLGAEVRSVTTLDEVSAAGLSEQAGVILLEVPADSAAARAGLQRLDVILKCNGQAVKNFAALRKLHDAVAQDKTVALEISRAQKTQTIAIPGGRR